MAKKDRNNGNKKTNELLGSLYGDDVTLESETSLPEQENGEERSPEVNESEVREEAFIEVAADGDIPSIKCEDIIVEETAIPDFSPSEEEGVKMMDGEVKPLVQTEKEIDEFVHAGFDAILGQQENTSVGNTIENIIGGLSEMVEQQGVTMETAGTIKLFKFAEAIKLVLGANIADDVIFSAGITQQKLVEMAKGNMDTASRISGDIYANGLMPIAWLISLSPSNYVTTGVTSAHILQNGNFNRNVVDTQKIVQNYGEYMIKSPDGTVTPYIDAEPYVGIAGTASVTAVLSSKRIMAKLAAMVANAEGYCEHKFRFGVQINQNSIKDSMIVLSVLTPKANSLLPLK